MNLNILKHTIILIGLFVANLSVAQCNSEELVNSSVSTIPNGYNFLKSYKIDGEPDLEKIEFSYVLTRGTSYILTIKDRNNSIGTVVTLFDTQRNKIASNKIGNKMVSALSFPCNATGIYYIQYTFDPGSNRCGGAALGFKR
ncbi:MAG: hypothetical protein KF860_17455 [Cyclobacteriaceae bacterium]|nr:hypothetical protein [Cyclobacteriaceae bacterium]